MPENEKLSKRSDEQLITAVLRGDTPPYGILVERYWKMVVALALSKINDATEAEDIAQDSFIKAYLQLHKLRYPGRFAVVGLVVGAGGGHFGCGEAGVVDFGRVVGVVGGSLPFVARVAVARGVGSFLAGGEGLIEWCWLPVRLS